MELFVLLWLNWNNSSETMLFSTQRDACAKKKFLEKSFESKYSPKVLFVTEGATPIEVDCGAI